MDETDNEITQGDPIQKDLNILKTNEYDQMDQPGIKPGFYTGQVHVLSIDDWPI